MSAEEDVARWVFQAVQAVQAYGDANPGDPQVVELREAMDRMWKSIEAEIADPTERVAHIGRTLGKRGMMAYRSYCQNHYYGDPT